MFNMRPMARTKRVIRIDRSFADLLGNMRKDMSRYNLEQMSDSALTRKIAKEYQEFVRERRRQKQNEGWI